MEGNIVTLSVQARDGSQLPTLSTLHVLLDMLQVASAQREDRAPVSGSAQSASGGESSEFCLGVPKLATARRIQRWLASTPKLEHEWTDDVESGHHS